MPAADHEHVKQQKQFFEQDPPRLATLLFGNPKFPRNMQKKIAYVARAFAGCDRILEVGTGRGLQLGFLLDRLGARTRYVGIDVAHRPVVSARAGLSESERSRVTLATGHAEGLPFADASFDGVFCLDVLHHASSQAAMIQEMARVLRPGGRLICVEPNPIYPVNLIYLRDPIEKGMFLLTMRNARRWAKGVDLRDLRLDNLAVFFPSFPRSFGVIYERIERLLDQIPGVRRLSTTRVLSARRGGKSDLGDRQ
jgi:SAM-dependent methyltransferase